MQKLKIQIKIQNYLSRPQVILFLILATGFFLRFYKPLAYFMYGHDQDLAGWIIKDVLINKHLRLIGQETSSQGIFIGPVFYYLQIPFYLLTGMDPKGTVLLPVLLGVLSIFSFYFCFSKIFNQKIGLIASFIYALSFYVIFIDREVVPTMPVMLWTVWYFYGLYLISQGKNKAYSLLAFLIGFIWNLNLALLILTPLVFLAQFFSKKKPDFKHLVLGILVLFLTLSPFIIFEVRHEFQQIKAIASSLITPKDYVEGTSRGFAKFDRVMQLVRKNTTSLYWDSMFDVPVALTFYVLVLSFVFLVIKKKIPRDLALLMFLWQLIYIIFFTVNSINPSEYYLNGMNVIWIAILSLGIFYLLETDSLRKIGVFILALFMGLNLYGFFNWAPNESGYLQRKALVDFIAKDASKRGFPCVAVSYITKPGYNLGYRYLFYIKDMHVNNPSSGSPVYTIVFPHSLVERIDKSFGALGLVLPDYERYSPKEVKISCSGANSNLTDPMFGYTE